MHATQLLPVWSATDSGRARHERTVCVWHSVPSPSCPHNHQMWLGAMKQKSRVPSLAVLWNRPQDVTRAPVLLPSQPSQLEFQEQPGMKEKQKLLPLPQEHTSECPHVCSKGTQLQKSLFKAYHQLYPGPMMSCLEHGFRWRPKAPKNYSDVYCLRKSCSLVRAMHQT